TVSYPQVIILLSQEKGRQSGMPVCILVKVAEDGRLPFRPTVPINAAADVVVDVIELESARAAVVQHHVPMSLPKEKDRDRQTANLVQPAQRLSAVNADLIGLSFVLKRCSL